MDILFREVTTKKVQNNIEKFESLTLTDARSRNQPDSSATLTKPVIEVDSVSKPVPLLTAISSRTTEKLKVVEDQAETKLLRLPQPVVQHRRKDSAIFLQKDYLRKDAAPPTLADDAREILKCQPGIEDIEAVLTYIQYGIDGQHDFDIRIAGPKSSMLIRVLVTVTIPDLWPALRPSNIGVSLKTMKQTMLSALFNIAGIEVLLEQIRLSSKTRSDSTSQVLQTYFEVLESLLEGPNTIYRLLNDVTNLYEKDIQRRLFWQGVVSLVGGSKILATTSGLSGAGQEFQPFANSWLVRGSAYSQWLARNIIKASVTLNPTDNSSWLSLSQLFKWGLSLGYREIFVATIYSSLLIGTQALWTPLHQLMESITTHDQKIVFNCIMSDLSRVYLVDLQHLPANDTDPKTLQLVAGAAALISGLIERSDFILECAIDWVSSSNGSYGNETAVRRALVAALARSKGNLERVLERSMISFSDKLQIQHMPSIQQEYLAQTILLIVGILQRQDKTALKQDPIPSLTMHATSNRLASSVPRNRLLGMMIGVAISQSVDEPSKALSFDVEEMETAEVQEMLGLKDVADTIGDIQALETSKIQVQKPTTSKKRKAVPIQQRQRARKLQQSAKVLDIEEIQSSEDDEDDLTPYQKPHNDPEDSDEDPTLINRDKSDSPIYIVDLIKQLQSNNKDKPDRIYLALKTASSLIRRKAGFGTELSDNIRSLAAALMNLQDGMSEPERQQQKLDAMIACLVMQPEQMGKDFTNTYFNGDFSLSQRSAILIAMGLAARELAGFRDAQNSAAEVVGSDMFPSKRLPPHLLPNISASKTNQERLAVPPDPLSMLSNMATRQTIQPMAVAAAKTQTGPEILQVTRTSARLITAKNKASSKSQVSKKPRNFYAILTNSFYLPIATPLSAILSYAAASSGHALNTSLLHPSILTLHLHTLTLLLHTLGPIGLSSPSHYASVAYETLAILTALHNVSRLCYDGVVLPAMLGLLLALIDITSDIGVSAQERLLADPFGNSVAELVRWLSGLQDGGQAPPPLKDEEGSGSGGVAWTVIAAGIQVQWYEMGRKLQGRMLGMNLDE